MCGAGRDKRQEHVVYCRRCGHKAYVAVGAELRATASRLVYDKHCGAHVPAVEVEFPIAVEKSGCHITHVHGRRPESPQPAHSGHYARHIVEIVVRRLALVYRKSCRHHSVVKRTLFGAMYGVAVEKCSGALHGVEHLVEICVVDHSHHRASLILFPYIFITVLPI